MYRSYEDPRKLQERLDELEKEQEQFPGIDLSEEIEEIKQRINFAWQDEEYDC